VVQEKKLDGKTCCFAQQNGFHPTFFHMMLKLVKGTTKPKTINWLNNLINLGVLLNTC
jgi:hypothetical protein